MTRSSTLGRPAAIGVALALATLVSGASSTASAQGDVTFTKDVAPIIFENCVSCHRPGQTAPMPLRSYAEVRPWARGIKEQVVSGAMPPWFADARHGFFKNDMRLEQQEIDTIAQWVDAGAPQGAPSDLPELPTFSEGWQLGEPDLIVTLNEVTVPAVCEGNTEGSGGLRSARLNAAGAAEGGSSGAGCVGGDYYPDLNHTLDIPEKRWIRAIEVKPSNRKVTHHSVIFTTGGAAQGASRSGFFDVLAVWSVGTNPHEFPEGSGRWVYPGQTWNINAHYHPTGEVETDRTQIGLYWGEGEMQKEVVAALAGTVGFEIPPHASNHEIRSSYIIDQDVHVISYFPHGHVRMTDMDLIANYPNGEKRSLINVPKYDFDWQLFYYPQQPVPLPAGTRLDIIAHYDNSAANPNNPDPNRAVGFGLETVDEMMFNVFEFIADEGVSPTPASDETRRDALLKSLPTGSAFSVELPFAMPFAPATNLPTVLHLPKDGEGTWYIPMRGELMVFPAENVTWNGNAYQFDLKLRLGPMKSDLVVSGEVDADGAIQGTFEAQGNSLSPLQAFEGALAGAGN